MESAHLLEKQIENMKETLNVSNTLRYVQCLSRAAFGRHEALRKATLSDGNCYVAKKKSVWGGKSFLACSGAEIFVEKIISVLGT